MAHLRNLAHGPTYSNQHVRQNGVYGVGFSCMGSLAQNVLMRRECTPYALGRTALSLIVNVLTAPSLEPRGTRSRASCWNYMVFGWQQLSKKMSFVYCTSGSKQLLLSASRKARALLCIFYSSFIFMSTRFFFSLYLFPLSDCQYLWHVLPQPISPADSSVREDPPDFHT